MVNFKRFSAVVGVPANNFALGFVLFPSQARVSLKQSLYGGRGPGGNRSDEAE